MPHSFEDLTIFDTKIMTLQGDIIKYFEECDLPQP